ncbi:MAG: endonuclease/exonuclease/phosphatase family protein [Planctomycetota bacterium]|nr:endonuclease/exonuclease/phosphatase family protein [Planctomycetota bacterium]
MKRLLFIFAAAFFLNPGVATAQEEFRVCAYNVESNGAWTNFVKKRIADMRKIDLWALSEVKDSKAAKKFMWAAEVGEKVSPYFRYILGTTGGYDRLVILYNTKKFKLVKSFELHHINSYKAVRAPLVALLKSRKSGKEFYFMVNHLYRSNAKARHKQATQLNAWGKKQKKPVVTAGDFNFDWHIPTGKHDKGYDNMTKNGVFRWVRPKKLSSTQAAYSPTVLDFIFVSGDAKSWKAEAWIIKQSGDFAKKNKKKLSDHRPVIAKFTIPK